MTMVVPCRLMTRQRSHIGLTDALTFIGDLFVETALSERGMMVRAHAETPCGDASS
jgi:hypothetical protein